MKRLLIGLAAAALTAGVAHAAPATQMLDTSLGKVLADDHGMVLYTFDNDTKGAAASACAGRCIATGRLSSPRPTRQPTATGPSLTCRQGRRGEEDVGLQGHAGLLLVKDDRSPATPPATASAASGTS